MENEEQQIMDPAEVPDVEPVDVEDGDVIMDLKSIPKTTELLGREDILEASDLQYALVDVSEWANGKTSKVLVRSLTGAERDALEESMVVGKGKNQKMSYTHFRAKLVVKAIIDKEGNRVFTEKDILALSRKNASPLGRVAETVTRLSGISKDDVDEMMGNSESEAGDGS